jgi:hypothetical protein
MKSAGVNIDEVIENVLAQRCDPLAGWWALLIEKEQRDDRFSRRLLAALRRRRFFASASRSRRLRSLFLSLTTLQRMKSAGVNIDEVIENVLAQRCDPLAGWWAPFSMTSSILTPALFIRCNVVFSSGVVNGDGLGIFRRL